MICHSMSAAIDIAVIEATEILPDGGVVPGAAGGMDVAEKLRLWPCMSS